MASRLALRALAHVVVAMSGAIAVLFSTGAATTKPSQDTATRAAALSARAGRLIAGQKLVEAENVLSEAATADPHDAAISYNLAAVHAALGKSDAAMDELERAVALGFLNFAHLRRNPAFAAMRELPRFQQLLAREQLVRQEAGRRILAESRSRFGPSYLYELDEADRLVFAVHADRKALQSLQSLLRSQAASQWDDLFTHKPEDFIRVVVATPADFARLERRRNIGGHYDDGARMLLVKTIGPELRHEFTHALHFADQHALGQEHPPWITEGLATLYENPLVQGAGGVDERIIPNQTWRLADARFAAKRGNYIPLAGLLTMDHTLFTSRANLTYDEAGSLLLYLYQQRLLKKFYDAYTAGYDKDPTGAAALQQVTAMKLPELQAKWVQWLTAPVAPK